MTQIRIPATLSISGLIKMMNTFTLAFANWEEKDIYH